MIAAMDLVDWLILIGRVLITFAGLLVTVMILIWIERKVIADMQTRVGPNRAGPRGILITLADGIKLFFKEGITPAGADRPVYLIAPIIAVIPAFLAFAVIPFGTGINLFGRFIPFQLVNLDIGILWILAMSSLGVYAVVLAGWSSGSKYPLLGAIRSSAQMISYEVGMGLALVAVLMYAGTLDLGQIVAKQNGTFWGFIPKWNFIPQFPAFAIYVTAALAEVNRPPFDLAEAETELVAGYHTEYSGIKFAMFYLGEYLNTITVSAVAVTLFLGGPLGPHPHDFLPWLWPVLWFVAKLLLIVFIYIWIRATLPRFRYDRLMNFGWRWLIPIGLIWILFTGAVLVLPDELGRGTFFRYAAIAVGAVVLASLFWPQRKTEPEPEREEVAP